MNGLKAWFNALAPRERLMVAGCAVVVVFALFYFALWSPLNTALANARQSLTAEANQAQWMLGIKNEAQLLRTTNGAQQPADTNQSMLEVIDSTSRASQLGRAVTHIEPQNDGQTIVSLQDASFDEMVYWLQTLQTKYGIRVSQATISREDDKPGDVSARLTLVRGAS